MDFSRKGRERRAEQIARLKAERRRFNWRHRLARLAGIRERRALNAEEQSRINKMSNWQRNQWARAGYPKDRIDEFVAMERRRESVAV